MTSHPWVGRVLHHAYRVPLPVWLLLMVALPVGTAGVGLWLLNQRDLSECEAAKTSPTVTDSTRLYCAQVLATGSDANDLVAAIQMADAIALDHPLRADGDRLIAQWAEQVLEKAEARVQDGNLTDAIALVDQIPQDTPTYAKAQPKKLDWQRLWTDAEAIYAAAQTALSDEKPSVALAEARKLLRLRNDYWSRTRFQALANEIQSWKENRNAEKRSSPSPSPTAIAQTTDDLISQWDREQAAEAKVYLDKAKQQAADGSVQSLRDAIASAEMVFSGTPQYPQAQQFIDTWTRQIEVIEDRPYLDQARQLARKGDVASLQAAIREANNIYFGRALYQEAQAQIDQWTATVRELHEQQYSAPAPPPVNPTVPAGGLPANQFNEGDRTPSFR